MLAFGALIDRSLAPLASNLTMRLRQALPALPGRVSVSASQGGEAVVAHLADVRALPFDADLPLWDGDLLVAGTLRLDAREALRVALRCDTNDGDSDAQLVHRAYHQWGVRLAEHLLGDFAFVVWDRAQRRLVCARDPHGNRQLYWGCAGAVMAVGSSVDIVRSLPGVSSDLHAKAVSDFVRHGWPMEADRTVFRAVHRVPAAHTVVLQDLDPPRLRRHWAFPVPSPIRHRDPEDYAAQFREVLQEAVRDRMRTPTAAIYLSGGMDSTMLAATARRAAPEVSLSAFTMSYPTVAPSDDEALSVEVATRLGLPHTVFNLDRAHALSYLEDLDALPPLPMDEPDLAPSRETLAPIAACAPVVIDGEDGDWLLHAPTLLTQLRTQPLAEVIGSWGRFWWRTGRRPWVGLEWRDRLRRWRRSARENRTPWLRAADASDYAVADAATPAIEPEHPLRPRNVRALSAPIWDALYEALSPAVTRQSVLHTLPLMDPRVMAFVFAIPPVPWCQEKHLFRVAMRDALPPAVLARPKTPLAGSFEAQVARWRAAGGAGTRISERVAPWVDVETVRRVLRAGTPYEVIDAWRVLQLDRWLEREERRRA
ncbi:MAG: hypothetical protein FJ363_05965 [Gemmatimonadetes bacterium]|nr:hypothetical protein [Gemmatimonadota bacterium]